jgi:hypothetical protein
MPVSPLETSRILQIEEVPDTVSIDHYQTMSEEGKKE